MDDDTMTIGCWFLILCLTLLAGAIVLSLRIRRLERAEEQRIAMRKQTLKVEKEDVTK